MRRPAALASGFALAALLAGCAATADGPIDAKAVYEARCALCHPAFAPTDHAPEEWPALVDKFAPQAGLTRAERDAVLAYLVREAGKR